MSGRSFPVEDTGHLRKAELEACDKTHRGHFYAQTRMDHKRMVIHTQLVSWLPFTRLLETTVPRICPL